MLEKGRISPLQMGMIMYSTVTATAILSLPAITAMHAGRDMWLSPIWGLLSGGISIFLAIMLGKRYPQETVIEYSNHILGRILGKLVGLIYLLFYIHLSSLILKEYGYFLVNNFYMRTPIIVIIGSFALLCAFNARGGIEVIARTATLLTPIAYLLLFATIVLITPKIQPQQMLPMFEHGAGPSLRGSISVQAWYSEFFLLSFLLPYMHDKHLKVKSSMVALLAVMVTLVLVNMASLMFMGSEESGRNVYPLLGITRSISVAGFFQHLESLVMFFWVAGTFIKFSMFSYVSIIGTSQWLGLPRYQPLVMPVVFLIVVISQWGDPRLQELIRFMDVSLPSYLLVLQIAVPAALLLISLARRKMAG
ncbi:GerAB/ArcD/ProY family transporter [Paenibacillus spongiae]|uniref:Spore germination protein n=1 Tax=Paenibacillus spongiae TaxID=2909671 RepID=A0ABY5S8X8_9BACL|nr:spore germination protein [Paenibacillus spongiae]UVI28753.1 spore germination protein [Paenibacillus spongiae]